MTRETYYSHTQDNEEWSVTEIGTAIDDYYDGIENGADRKVGDTITIYRGECKTQRASFYCVDFADDISNCAYDKCGDWAESWLEGREHELDAHIKKAVDEWCDNNGEQPKFGTMENVIPLMIRIVENGYEIEPEEPTNE